MKYRIPFIVLFFISCLNGYSTAQYPDQIEIDGKTHALLSNPLEQYFENNPDTKPETKISLSSLHRGYIAVFELKDSIMLLKEIKVPYPTRNTTEIKWVNIIDSIFPDQKEIEVDWYNGILVIPTGKMKKYIHGWYASTFKKYKIIEITNGIMTGVVKYNLKEFIRFKERSYLQFKSSEEYDKVYAKIKKRLPNYTDESIDALIKERITDYITKIDSE